MKILEKKTIKLKILKTKIKDELEKIKVEYAKLQEENKYLRLEILRSKRKKKIYISAFVFSWMIMLLLYWLLLRMDWK